MFFFVELSGDANVPKKQTGLIFKREDVDSVSLRNDGNISDGNRNPIGQMTRRDFETVPFVGQW